MGDGARVAQSATRMHRPHGFGEEVGVERERGEPRRRRAPLMRDVCAAKVVTQRSPRGERLRVSLGEDARLRHEPHAGSKPGCEWARMRARRVVMGALV